MRVYCALVLCVAIHVAMCVAAPLTLEQLICTDTTALELPTELLVGVGDSQSMQIVINIHTDNHGNIEIFPNST